MTAPTLLQKPCMDMFRELNAKVASANAGPESASAPMALVPEVDLTPFLEATSASDEAREPSIAAALAACRNEGFMNVRGHGVPQEAVSELRRVCRAFFNRSVEEKSTSTAAAAEVKTARGYTGFRTENLGDVLGRKEYADMRESYDMGPPDWTTDANIWPDEAVAPGFRAAMEAYFGHMERVEKALCRLFSAALAVETGRSLPDGWMEAQIGRHRGLLRAAYYPPGAARPDESRCSAHTDWSPFTILFTEKEGLEVIQDGQWRRVPVLHDCFVVNVADQLERWSNGRFRSGVHRVKYDMGSPDGRLSFPYFSTETVDHTDNSIVQPIVVEGEPQRFEPISIKDYLMRNFAVMQGRKNPVESSSEEEN